MPLWMRIIVNEREPTQLRWSASSFLLDGNAAVHAELRRILDPKTPQGQTNRELIEKAAEATRKANPAFADGLALVLKKTSGCSDPPLSGSVLVPPNQPVGEEWKPAEDERRK
ncbi:MAG: hypothetical protein NTW87_06700 [Planctomycetota bacterium]|nr:hypothetical protein [Planctomycetota bacterium]